MSNVKDRPLMRVYVIFDKVAEEAGPPFVAPNNGVALRSMSNTLYSMPEVLYSEYELYCVATYDPRTMLIINHTPESIDFIEYLVVNKRYDLNKIVKEVNS